MPDRAKLARAKAANVLALVLIVLLVGGLLTSEAARGRQERSARDYQNLWLKERMISRQCVKQRLDSVEERFSTLPKKEVNLAYQARLADVRQRFTHVVRGPIAPTCPAAARVPVPAPIPSERADAACPFSEEEAVTARATAQQLAALQAWVLENMGEQK